VVFGGLRYSQLRGDARRSPLAVKPDNYGVSLGLAYRCCR
jgi:outer membrane scaffolding protein for murein synthesis (MipA/OmpV family)